MAKEYIERHALLRDIEDAVVFSVGRCEPSAELRGAGKIVDRIRCAPAADAVEVVRCRDCWKSADGLCGYQLKNVPGKDFCGDGERRDNDAQTD